MLWRGRRLIACLLKARYFDMTTGDFFDQVEKANPQKVVAYFEDEKWTAAQVTFISILTSYFDC